MSQVVKRKSAAGDEKEKSAESPMKDMKKKVAANAEKEKQVAEKSTEKQPEKSEKPAEKNDKSKQAEKPTDKSEKPKQPEKATEKDKPDKIAEKKVDKNGVDNKKTDSKEKKDTQDKKDDKADKNAKNDAKKSEKPKQNGSKHNGTDSNGVEEPSDDDVLEIADDEFPELAYDESDESPTPDSAPGRSTTRRSQVKAARTPETPQPSAEKPAETAAGEQAKDSKVLKLTEAPPTDRKLRSDDPKEKKDANKEEKKDGDKEEKNGDDDIIEILDDEPRKTDTNFSKSRVKVSPYRRSTRLADQTTSSTTANYTGNNTTMEMDITESSFAEDASLNDSYLVGLRSIRGRRSYKPLKELSLKHVNRSARSKADTSASGTSFESRPTGTVVGRKRKPSSPGSIEPATDALELAAHSKRMRLLDRIAQPFRRSLAPAGRDEIVGINTDLPLTAPVAAPTLDPESLKPTDSPTTDELDKKRCVVM